MRESKTSTPPPTPTYGDLNENKSRPFSLDEHRARMNLVWADYAEYRQILGELRKRVEALEEETKVQ